MWYCGRMKRERERNRLSGREKNRERKKSEREIEGERKRTRDWMRGVERKCPRDREKEREVQLWKDDPYIASFSILFLH